MAAHVTQYGLAQQHPSDVGMTDDIVEAIAGGSSVAVIKTRPDIMLEPYDISVMQTKLERITGNVVWNVAFEPDTSTVYAYHTGASEATRSDVMVDHSTDGPAIEFLKKDADGKIKRPKNAFLIYRLEHHALTAALNPDMHNNDISKVIGKRWSSESQEVRDQYKQKAEEEKRQHAIEHPGYQYKPRKPSEKKRRMTKKKLAKLADVVENVRERQHFRAVVNPTPPAAGMTAATQAALPAAPMPYPVNLGAPMPMPVAPTMTYAHAFLNPLPAYTTTAPAPVQNRISAGQSNSSAAQLRQSMLNNADFDMEQYFNTVQFEIDFSSRQI
ncbi:unnamed protein product [Zymoseptoria tritici ST99CH_1A5]|uniref:HMG box domain-containing protein n=1 Tax=Zymoseptoria tritici ST99CH_1A5 TaxID=1276529 RepID=A0A1Y6M4C9_ZYMTR|nr:unnamed protein product [Zymoseptoria tritici ST99CH_3D1]SMY29871.1 unnamed protein product [Zymoseptoria tritici ST99CH_1A5]